MKRSKLSEAARQMGRKGGKARARKHTQEQLREWGKRGGRPPKASAAETALVKQINRHFEAQKSHLRVVPAAKVLERAQGDKYCLIDLSDNRIYPTNPKDLAISCHVIPDPDALRKVR